MTSLPLHHGQVMFDPRQQTEFHPHAWMDFKHQVLAASIVSLLFCCHHLLLLLLEMSLCRPAPNPHTYSQCLLIFQSLYWEESGPPLH
jgi:hypothetical protein